MIELSIVIPIFNAERYIEECLCSILNEIDMQTEVLLFDDGSSDNSYEIINRYAGINKQIKSYHHENRGVSYTRNRGIAKATGKYIMFVDADDKLKKGWYTTVLSGCESGKDIVYFGKQIGFTPLNTIPKTEIIKNIFCVPDKVNLGNLSSPWSKLYRRDFIRENGISFDEALINGEDLLFNLEAILKTNAFGIESAQFYQYRIWQGSSSKKFNDKFFDSNLQFLTKAERLLNKTEIPTSVIERCMAYSVVYGIYLYLLLAASIEDADAHNVAIGKIYSEKMLEYVRKYKSSNYCNKYIRIIYWLIRHHQLKCADLLVSLRKAFWKAQKGEMRWEVI